MTHTEATRVALAAALTASMTLAALAAVAAAPLAAQTALVLPPSHATVEGSGSTNVPFGRSVPMRAQMAYDGILFTGPMTVTRLAFRLDGAAMSAGKQVDLELRLSTLAFGVTAIQPYFAANRGADETVVFARRTIQLPAAASASPAPFLVQLPLDVAFGYDPGRGALLVEAIVHGQQPGAFALDATFTCVSPFTTFGPPGCGPQLSVLSSQVLWGSPLYVQLAGAAPSAPTVLVLGSIESGTWGSVTIPLDLTPFGAPGCHLATDLLAAMAATADATGVATYQIRIPSVPRLQLTWLRFQGLAVDYAANPLGVVGTTAGKVQVCGWEPVSRVFAPTLGAVSGSREIGVAPVLELTIR